MCAEKGRIIVALTDEIEALKSAINAGTDDYAEISTKLDAAESDKRILLQTTLELKADNEGLMKVNVSYMNELSGLRAEIERLKDDLARVSNADLGWQGLARDRLHMLDALCRALEIAESRFKILVDRLEDGQFLWLALEFERNKRLELEKRIAILDADCLAIRAERDRLLSASRTICQMSYTNSVDAKRG